MATSDVLAALDDETQLRIVANTLGGGELTGTQKQRPEHRSNTSST